MLAKLAACPTGATRRPAAPLDRHTDSTGTHRGAGPQAEPARQDRVPHSMNGLQAQHLWPGSSFHDDAVEFGSQPCGGDRPFHQAA
jgi:hypothetical protein